MASHASLEASTQDRKSRLAQLRSLKQKQQTTEDGGTNASRPSLKRKSPGADEGDGTAAPAAPSDVTSSYLSGRNYDAAVRGPKLGFEFAPAAGQDTVEAQAAAIAAQTKAAAELEEKDDRPLDLFKLQPKKPNWDLKRDMDKRLDVLSVRTDNTVARLVRNRIAKQKEDEEQQRRGKGAEDGQGDGEDGAAVGMEGTAFIEAVRAREREVEGELREENEQLDADE